MSILYFSLHLLAHWYMRNWPTTIESSIWFYLEYSIFFSPFHSTILQIQKQWIYTFIYLSLCVSSFTLLFFSLNFIFFSRINSLMSYRWMIFSLIFFPFINFYSHNFKLLLGIFVRLYKWIFFIVDLGYSYFLFFRTANK